MGDIFGSGEDEAPAISGPEQHIIDKQMEAAGLSMQSLRNQLGQLDVLNPELLRQLGFEGQFGEEGDLTGLTEDPRRADLRERGFLAEEGFRDKQMAALRGELDLDPRLSRLHREQRETLNERLRKQIGTGFGTSTAGIQALGDLTQRQAETEFGAARSDISLFQQLALAEQQANQARQASAFGGLATLNQLQGATAPGFTQASQAFGQAGLPYQQQRGQQSRLDIADIQARGAAQAGLFGALGSAATMGIMGGFGAFTPSQAEEAAGRWYDGEISD